MAAAKPASAPKRFHNIRAWRHFDDKTLKDTFHVPNTPYEGPVYPVLLAPEGPDGFGPCIAENLPGDPNPLVPSDSEEN